MSSSRRPLSATGAAPRDASLSQSPRPGPARRALRPSTTRPSAAGIPRPTSSRAPGSSGPFELPACRVAPSASHVRCIALSPPVPTGCAPLQQWPRQSGAQPSRDASDWVAPTSRGTQGLPWRVELAGSSAHRSQNPPAQGAGGRVEVTVVDGGRGGARERVSGPPHLVDRRTGGSPATDPASAPDRGPESR